MTKLSFAQPSLLQLHYCTEIKLTLFTNYK